MAILQKHFSLVHWVIILETEKIELDLVKWVNDGFTLGYINEKPIFVLGGIPGEKVICEVFEVSSKFKKAKVINILHKSSLRIQPPCSIYLNCGGCSFQHIDYESERSIKKKLLIENLIYSGIIISDQNLSINYLFSKEYHYRNNVQLKIQKVKIGFFKIKSNDIVKLPDDGCNLLHEKLNEYILNNKMLNFDGKFRYDSEGIKNYSKDISVYNINNKNILLPKNSFFQINSYLIESWLGQILEYSGNSENILELFSGAGTISVFLAERHKSLEGYELSYDMVNSSITNTGNLSKCKFIKKDLYKEKINYSYNDFICVANPPRAGLGKIIKKFIIEKKPKKIIYSSCNYTTLIPDLKDLMNNYKILSIDIIDFFPRTPYIETLVVLEKI